MIPNFSPKLRHFSMLDFLNILIVSYMLLPLGIIILFSFSPTATTIFPMQGFTAKWYLEVWKNPMLMEALANSFYVAITVSLFSTLIGGMGSFALTRYEFKLKKLVLFWVLIPIALPAILLGIALLSFFSMLDIPKSLVTVILAHTVFFTPFAILILNSRLQGFDTSIEEAARDLGANPFQTFRYVIFPLMRPSLFGVVMLIFALSFDEFLVTFFIIGKDNTLPIVIWGMLRRGTSPTINVIATLMLVFSMTLILGANKFVQLRKIQ